MSKLCCNNLQLSNIGEEIMELEINNDIRVKDLAGFCVGHFNFITLKKAVRVEDLIEDRNLLFCDSEALFIPSDAEVVGWFENNKVIINKIDFVALQLKECNPQSLVLFMQKTDAIDEFLELLNGLGIDIDYDLLEDSLNPFNTDKEEKVKAVQFISELLEGHKNEVLSFIASCICDQNHGLTAFQSFKVSSNGLPGLISEAIDAEALEPVTMIGQGTLDLILNKDSSLIIEDINMGSIFYRDND